MARNFDQTGTAAACGTVAMCSGATVANTPQGLQCVESGTSGSEVTVTNSANTSTIAAVMFQLESISDTSWASGTWTVRLNVTTANTSVTLQEVYVCRANSSCTNQATVGSTTGIGTTLSSGVKTVNVTGSAQTAASGDDAYVVMVFDFGGAHGNQSFGFTPDQQIDTPLDALALQGSADFAGSGTLAAGGSVMKVGGADLAGSGALAADGTVSKVGAAAFFGSGALAADASVMKVGAAAFAGSGSLAADGTVTSGALEGAAAFAGSGALAADASVMKVGAVAFAGSGALTADGTVTSGALEGAAAFAGSGEMVAAGTVTMQGGAAFAGAGALAANGILGSLGAYQGAAAFAGVGAMSLATVQTMQAGASFAGSGSMRIGAPAAKKYFARRFRRRAPFDRYTPYRTGKPEIDRNLDEISRKLNRVLEDSPLVSAQTIEAKFSAGLNKFPNPLGREPRGVFFSGTSALTDAQNDNPRPDREIWVNATAAGSGCILVL